MQFWYTNMCVKKKKRVISAHLCKKIKSKKTHKEDKKLASLVTTVDWWKPGREDGKMGTGSGERYFSE